MKNKYNKLALALALAGFQVFALAETPSNSADYTRTTQFKYDAYGEVQTMTVEPNNPGNCLVKTFAPGTAGNPGTVSAANCTGATGMAMIAPRQMSSNTYAAVPAQQITVAGTATTVSVPAGLFADSVADALNQTENYQYDPRFGTKIYSKTVDGQVSTNVVDDWGRIVKVIRPDGTTALTAYCILKTDGTLDTSQPSNSPNCPSTFAVNEVPAGARTFTHAEFRDVNNNVMGAFTRVYHDFLNRTIRTATQGFDGAAQPATVATSLVVTDTVYDIYGNPYLTTQPYFLATGSPSTSGANDAASTETVYDALGRPTAVYKSSSTDASTSEQFGVAGTFSYGSYGTQKAAVTTYAYTGTQVTLTDDKQYATKTERTALGAIGRVTDQQGAQVAYLYDAFGNTIETLDALQNVTTNVYDFIGKRVYVSDPDRGTVTSCYDVLGQLKANQNSIMSGSRSQGSCPTNGDTGLTATAVLNWSTLAYDPLGRLRNQVEPEQSTTYSYDSYADGSTCSTGTNKICEIVVQNQLDKRYSFDSLGRPVSERIAVTNGPTIAQSQTYDATTGRQSLKTYPTGLQVKNVYSPLGYSLQLLSNTAVTVQPLPNAQGTTASPGTIAQGQALWTAVVVNAAGKPEQVKLGNQVVESVAYEDATGRIVSDSAGTSASPTGVMNQAYAWNSVGNLSGRTDNLGDGQGNAVSETFSYDGISRLTDYAVTGSFSGYSRDVGLTYNALGMLLSKSDVGNYTYPAQGGSYPHAVQSISGSGAAYHYDLNGNLLTATAGPYNNITYSSFDKVLTASSGSANYSWGYDEHHARTSETHTLAGDTRTTYYFNPDAANGLSFEVETDTSPSLESNRHYLTAFGNRVGVLVTTGPLPALSASQLTPSYQATLTANKAEFWTMDFLGSLSATTDHTGALTARYAYDPFGKRRFVTGGYDETGSLVVDWNPSQNFGTGRGFTAHEQLDDIGLVNANGRLYDSTNGLFIQADNHLTNGYNLQNLNRYAYVLNNPLNATDQTGYDGEPAAATASASSSSSPSSDGGADIFASVMSEYSTTGIVQNMQPGDPKAAAVAFNNQGGPDFWNSFTAGFTNTGNSTWAKTNEGFWITGRIGGITMEGFEGTKELGNDIVMHPYNWLVSEAGAPSWQASTYGSNPWRVDNIGMQGLYKNLKGLYSLASTVVNDFRSGNWQEGSAQVGAIALPFAVTKVTMVATDIRAAQFAARATESGAPAPLTMQQAVDQTAMGAVQRAFNQSPGSVTMVHTDSQNMQMAVYKAEAGEGKAAIVNVGTPQFETFPTARPFAGNNLANHYTKVVDSALDEVMNVHGFTMGQATYETPMWFSPSYGMSTVTVNVTKVMGSDGNIITKVNLTPVPPAAAPIPGAGL